MATRSLRPRTRTPLGTSPPLQDARDQNPLGGFLLCELIHRIDAWRKRGRRRTLAHEPCCGDASTRAGCRRRDHFVDRTAPKSCEAEHERAVGIRPHVRTTVDSASEGTDSHEGAWGEADSADAQVVTWCDTNHGRRSRRGRRRRCRDDRAHDADESEPHERAHDGSIDPPRTTRNVVPNRFLLRPPNTSGPGDIGRGGLISRIEWVIVLDRRCRGRRTSSPLRKPLELRKGGAHMSSDSSHLLRPHT